MTQEQLFSAALMVQEPWFVSAVSFDSAEKVGEWTAESLIEKLAEEQMLAADAIARSATAGSSEIGGR